MAFPPSPSVQGFQQPFPTETPKKSPKPTRTPIPTLPPIALCHPDPSFPPFASPTPRPTATAIPTSTSMPSGMINVPTGFFSVQVDGRCGSREYSDAFFGTFIDGNNTEGRVYIKHDASNLYVCMVGALGTYADRFASVYLDTDNRRGSMPYPDDVSLRVGIISGVLSSLAGAGSPGTYLPSQFPGWTAVSAASGQNDNGAQALTTDQVKFRIR